MSGQSSRALIDALRDAALWGEQGDVELLETHISWVLLTGEFAYKIKKPVDLGFVDFTTLERRRFFCDEELRLNRRLAPDLYLGVVPICGTPDQPRPAGAGEPLEFAVKMRRFSQESLLSRLIASDRLTPRHIDDLAKETAEFHSSIEVADPHSSRFGTLEQVFAPVEENFRIVQRAGEAGGRSSQIETLRDWSAQEFAARESDFQRRRQAGAIRECHGDMHLGNMILQPGGGEHVVIFDCIEFNDDLRWIDVMSEVAFVVMDLADRGRRDFGRRLLNTYLERTGDYAGLSVLPFYVVYRALVRAKVALLRGEQDETQSALRDEFRQYVDLALSEAEPRPTPLIITHGFSGSGKTTGTQSLVEQSGAIRLRSDIERRRLFAADARQPAADVGAGIYSERHTAATYEELARLAAAVIAAGFPAIVDATFLKRSQRDQFRRLAEQLGVEFHIADFRAPLDELRKRITQRRETGHDASEADLSVLDHQLQTDDPLAEDELPHLLPASNSQRL